MPVPRSAWSLTNTAEPSRSVGGTISSGSPPGGVLELDEAVHEGLIREVREETGLTVEAGPLTGVYKNLHRGIVALVFRCTADSGHASSTGEAVEVRWLEEETIQQHMDKAYAVRMLDVLRGGGVQVRAHDGISVIGGRR